MGERILVVDDEDTIRMVLTEVLTDDGYEVIEAASGEEALEAFRQKPFPVVISDIYMGKMTGIDLLQEIKLLDEDALVLIMTSNASLDTAAAALRGGAYDYLMKPFEELDLISNVVGRAMDKYRLSRDNRTLIEKLQENAKHLEALNRQLREAANRDGLTGLYNHRYFREALEVEISRATRHNREFSLVFIDIDHFKLFNDTNGHLIGDSLLKEMARILQRFSRAETFVARYGGEEFVLIVPEADRESGMVCAENLRSRVEQWEFRGAKSQPLGRVTFSAGVSTYPVDGETPNALIERADKALYLAKDSGRNAVRCWSEAQQAVAESAKA